MVRRLVHLGPHATEQMQRHYLQWSPDREQAEGLAKVLRMMDFRDRQASVGAPVGASDRKAGASTPVLPDGPPGVGASVGASASEADKPKKADLG